MLKNNKKVLVIGLDCATPKTLFEDFIDQLVGLRFIAVQQFQDGLLHATDNVGAYFRVTQFVFGLALKDRFFQAD